MKQHSATRKQNFASPQKTQTYIVAFSSNQKKQNSNATPPRTTVEHSYKAITASGTSDSNLISPPKNKNLMLSNNPYQLLADSEEPEPEEEPGNPLEEESRTSQDMDKGEESSPPSEAMNDNGSVSSAGISPTEKPLLSRKAQQVLRRLKAARKLLMDNSIREEILALYGAECVNVFDQQMDGDSKKDAEIEDGEEKPTEAENISENSTDTQNTFGATHQPLLPGETNNSSKSSMTKDVSTTIKDSADQPYVTLSKPDDSTPSSNSQGSATEVNSFCSVSFAAAAAKSNSNDLRGGGYWNGASKVSLQNPYLKKADSGILFAQQSSSLPARVDKIITLKKNNSRAHIHCYTLRFKTIKAKSDDEGHQIVQETLQRFLGIVLQADSKTIIPPYLELDRNDKSVSDLSTVFPVSSVDSYVIKKYFFRLSSRDDNGFNWCSIILAQSIPFLTFMEKSKILIGK